MALTKCPRCELNYCRKGQEYCDVCLKELAHRSHGSEPEENDEAEETVLCSECGEKPAFPGHDLCIDCLKEQNRLKTLGDESEEDLIDDDFSEEDVEEP